MERRYFLAKQGGQSWEAVRVWKKIARNANLAAVSLAKEFGATAIHKGWNHIEGMRFKSNPGLGWRQMRKGWNGLYCPNQRTKEGRAIAARIKAVSLPTLDLLSRLLGGGGFVACGMVLGFASFEEIGGNCVISIPVSDSKSKDQFVPLDTTPLKMSEYYALKEAEQERTCRAESGV